AADELKKMEDVEKVRREMEKGTGETDESENSSEQFNMEAKSICRGSCNWTAPFLLRKNYIQKYLHMV
ncbi:hypothetical protein HMPREF0987_00001, partial [Lachnospiraceae bacterium 9_1_43BFAA]